MIAASNAPQSEITKQMERAQVGHRVIHDEATGWLIPGAYHEDRSMHTSRWLPAVTLVLVLVAACSSFPRLVDYPVTHLDPGYLEQIFSAPIVLVGVIVSDDLVRGPIPSHHDPKVQLQLRKLRVRVENALRGEISEPTITIYYFGFASGFDGPRPLGLWSADTRRVFWVRRDSGALRTACDGWDSCTMAIDSGAHPNYKPDPQKTLGYALADIWFSRGDGITDADFARQVARGAPSIVPRQYLFEKLQQLAATEVPAVRTAACEQLLYDGQKCIDAVAKP